MADEPSHSHWIHTAEKRLPELAEAAMASAGNIPPKFFYFNSPSSQTRREPHGSDSFARSFMPADKCHSQVIPTSHQLCTDFQTSPRSSACNPSLHAVLPLLLGMQGKLQSDRQNLNSPNVKLGNLIPSRKQLFGKNDVSTSKFSCQAWSCRLTTDGPDYLHADVNHR